PAHLQVDVADPFESEAHRRPAGGVLVPGLPDAAGGSEPVGVNAREFAQVLRADLLLSLEEQPDPERQRADARLVRLDRLKPRHEVPLVVGGPTAVEEPVAYGRLEGRRRPLIERVRRLDVVVVVHQERPRAGALLADDRRRPVGYALGARGEAGATGAVEHEASRFLEPALLRG